MSKDRRDKLVSQKIAMVVALAMALCVAGVANATLVGQWTFNEGSGATAYDTSGFGNNGTIVGGATYVASPGGYAVSLDGMNDMMDTGQMFNMGGPFTLEAWVLKLDPESLGEAVVLGKDYVSYAMTSYHPNPAIDGFYLIYGNGGGNNVNTGTRITGQWSYLVETYDGSTIQMWWNGIDQGTKLVGVIPPTGNNLIVGGPSIFGSTYLHGLVDEANIYDTKLSDAEIAAHWAAGPSTAVIPEPTTVLLVIVGCGIMMLFKGKRAFSLGRR